MLLLGYRIGNLSSSPCIELVTTEKNAPLCVLMEDFVGFPCPLLQINLDYRVLRGAVLIDDRHSP